ncbi:hypothetical protein [Bacteroides sp.]
MKYIIGLCCILFYNTFCQAFNYSIPNDSVVADSIRPMAAGVNSDWIAPSMPQILYPNPSAMEMYKYLEHPISYATGLIDISIPLYTMKTANLDIPLQLKYHSSGIRIQDSEGVLGFGWSLFPGFKISRMVMGKPDEKYPVVDADFSKIGTQTHEEVEELANFSTFLTSYGGQDGYSRGQKCKDGQYDIFSIYTPNDNANFVLHYADGVYTPWTITEMPLKIEPKFDRNGNSLCKLYGFDVYDERGNKFCFGPVAPVLNNNKRLDYIEKEPVGGYVTGWLLREIIQPNGQKIIFSYEEAYEKTPGLNSTCTIFDDESNTGGTPSNFIVDTDKTEYVSNDGLSNTHIILLLSTIDSEETSVKFSYSQDFQSEYAISKKLVSILVGDKISGKSVKTITFTRSDRFFLKEINISQEGKYQFEYNMQENQLDYYAIDWWGYFNGWINSGGVLYNCPKFEIPINNRFGGSYSFYNQGIPRELNSVAMQAKSLKKIFYPTGGWLEIDYEPHQFKSLSYKSMPSRVVTGGGLRVKSTRLCDPVSNKVISKRYEYVVPDEGYLYEPNVDLFMKPVICCGYSPTTISSHAGLLTVRKRTITTFSPYSCIDYPIWYKEVTEYSDTGKTVYMYDFENNESVNFYGSFISTQLNGFAFPFPILLREDNYDLTNKKIHSIRYFYSLMENLDLVGIVVQPLKELLSIGGEGLPIVNSQNWEFVSRHGGGYFDWSFFEFNSSTSPVFGYMNYGIRMYRPELDSIHASSYFGNDSIVEKTLYEYDPDRIYNLSRKSVMTDDGKWLNERYYYTNNTIPDKNTLTSEQQNVIQQMENDNFKTTVIQRIKEKDGKRLYSQLTGFKKAAGRYLPEIEYFQKGNNSFEGRIKYHLYDNYGNPVQISMDDDDPIFYIWGYKGQYPIAEIRNAYSYNTLRNALQGRAPEGMSADTIPDYAKIEGLRTNRDMEDAQITTFRYDPSVGITQKTDSRGISTYYTYDNNGRLIEIYFMENGEKKVLESYQYNIKNQ